MLPGWTEPIDSFVGIFHNKPTKETFPTSPRNVSFDDTDIELADIYEKGISGDESEQVEPRMISSDVHNSAADSAMELPGQSVNSTAERSRILSNGRADAGQGISLDVDLSTEHLEHPLNTTPRLLQRRARSQSSVKALPNTADSAMELSGQGTSLDADLTGLTMSPREHSVKTTLRRVPSRKFSNGGADLDDEFALEERGSSVKSTPRSFLEIPSALKKVSHSAPHYLDSKSKLFFRMIVPHLLIYIISVYFQWTDCHAAYDEIDNEGIENCITPLAEVLTCWFFITVPIAAYMARQEMIKSSPRIFSFVEQTDPRDVAQLKIKNKDEWTDALTGRHVNFRPWNIRGHVVLPVAAIFLAITVYYTTLPEEGACAGITSCRPYGKLGHLFHSMRIASNMFLSMHSVVTSVYPFILISLIVGPSSKSRIGLWNQGDVSLGEVQRISMHFSLSLSVVAFVYLIINLFFAKYYKITQYRQASYVIMIASSLVAVLFVPIVPVIFALREIKETILADVSALEERANTQFLDLLRLEICERLEPGEIEQAEAEVARATQYHSKVQAANVIPSSVAVLRTSLSSLFIGVAFPIIVAKVLGASSENREA